MAKDLGVATENCPQCNAELEIPISIHEQIKKDEKKKYFDMSRLKAYDGFLVSPCASFYCDHKCYSMYLED